MKKIHIFLALITFTFNTASVASDSKWNKYFWEIDVMIDAKILSPYNLDSFVDFGINLELNKDRVPVKFNVSTKYEVPNKTLYSEFKNEEVVRFASDHVYEMIRYQESESRSVASYLSVGDPGIRKGHGPDWYVSKQIIQDARQHFEDDPDDFILIEKYDLGDNRTLLIVDINIVYSDKLNKKAHSYTSHIDSAAIMYYSVNNKVIFQKEMSSVDYAIVKGKASKYYFVTERDGEGAEVAHTASSYLIDDDGLELVAQISAGI